MPLILEFRTCLRRFSYKDICEYRDLQHPRPCSFGGIQDLRGGYLLDQVRLSVSCTGFSTISICRYATDSRGILSSSRRCSTGCCEYCMTQRGHYRVAATEAATTTAATIRTTKTT